MKKNIKELRQAKADKKQALLALYDAAEGRDFTAEETATKDALTADIEQTERLIVREEERMELAREAATKSYWEEEKAEEAGVKASKVQVGHDNNVDQPFESYGKFLMAVYDAGRPGGKTDPRLYHGAATGSNELVSSDGGFLVGKEESTELLRRTYESANLASRTRRIPIGAGKNGLSIPAIDESSRVTGSRWGGIRAYWADEAEEKTKSKPKFRKIDLKLRKLVGLHYATDELLEDYVALESISREAFSDEFAFALDDAILRGTGAGMPLGILNSPALVSVAKETNQPADTIIYPNILKMWSRMWAKSRPNAVWLVNQDAEAQLYSMSMVVGTGGVPVYMPAGGVSGTPYTTLFGRPVIAVEHAASLGDQGDIILADFSQYILIDKGGMKSDVSIHVRFIYDESVFRHVYRVDGQPTWNLPLTPYKGSATLSPYIVLDARA